MVDFQCKAPFPILGHYENDFYLMTLGSNGYDGLYSPLILRNCSNLLLEQLQKDKAIRKTITFV
jgi:hypothetical protein